MTSTRRAPPGDRDGLRCELAVPGDDEALRRLLREGAMDGWVRLAFPAEPSYFGARSLEGRRAATVVVRLRGDGSVVGMGSRSVKEVHLGGRPALLGYLGRLRFQPGWRAGRRTLARGYALLRERRRPDELPFDLTSVVADNTAARRLLERGVPGLPRYTPVAELVTLVLATGGRGGGPVRARARRRSRRGPGLVVEEAPDLDALAEGLARAAGRAALAPRWTRSRLEELAAGRLGPWLPLVARDGGEILGCGAVWDQRPIRQCVVHGYAPWLRRLRPILHAGLRAVGRPGLPPPGSALRLGYLSHLVASDPGTVAALVAAARARAARLGLRYLAVAFPAGGGEVERLRRRVRGHAYRSVLYAVHDPGFDPGATGLLDGTVRVEAATL